MTTRGSCKVPARSERVLCFSFIERFTSVGLFFSNAEGGMCANEQEGLKDTT